MTLEMEVPYRAKRWFFRNTQDSMSPTLIFDLKHVEYVIHFVPQCFSGKKCHLAYYVCYLDAVLFTDIGYNSCTCLDMASDLVFTLQVSTLCLPMNSIKPFFSYMKTS